MTILKWGAVTRAASGPAQRPGLPPAAAFWLVAGAWFLLLFAAAAPSPLYGVYQAQWRFSAITLTAVFGVYALGLLVALLVFGSVSDYLGRRRVISVANALAGHATRQTNELSLAQAITERRFRAAFHTATVRYCEPTNRPVRGGLMTVWAVHAVADPTGPGRVPSGGVIPRESRRRPASS